MKKLAVATILISLFSVGAYATTWIGVISDRHCGPNFTPIRGDDIACIVFEANDHEVYKVSDQEAIKPYVGKEVTIVGTLTQELTIGVTYESQGILKIDSISLISPLEVNPQEASKYQGWMKSLQPQVGAVRKAIGAKDNALVATEANKLAAILDPIAGFWQEHRNADALQFAVTGRDSSKSIATETSTVEQTATLQKVQDACAGCHLAHRSGTSGHFQIVK